MSEQARYKAVLFERVEIQQDIVFRTTENQRGEPESLSLDIYTPAGDLARHRPAILWIHGGGFRPGSDKRQRYIIHMSTEFAKRGYVCFAPDYRVRLNPGEDRLGAVRDAVEDCRAALEWLRERQEIYGIDRTHIAVGGGSAGGMIGVSLCAMEARDAALHNRPGVFAFADLWGSPDPSWMLMPLDERFPPTVIVHGTGDQLVPFAQSEKLAETLSQLGVHHLLCAIPDAPHTPMAHLPEIVETVARFFYTALEG
jgi:acetyl esterase/lipase